MLVFRQGAEILIRCGHSGVFDGMKTQWESIPSTSATGSLGRHH